MDKEIRTKIYKLNPTTVIVQGASKSTLCDLEKDCFYSIPNALAAILLDTSNNTIDNAISAYGKNNITIENILIDYFEYLLKNDLIFFTNNIDNYEILQLDYDYPGYISNGIIDISNNDIQNAISFISQSDQIQCRAIQIRVYCHLYFNNYIQLLECGNEKIIEWFELILPYNDKMNISQWQELITDYKRLRSVIIYGYPSDEVIFQRKYGTGKIVGIKNTIIDHFNCGVVGPQYFNANILSVSESFKFNSC